MTSGDQKIAKIQTNFKVLFDTASSLNTASGELTSTISILDEALKKLNIGLNVWVTFRSRSDDDEPYLYDEYQIGYSKVDGTWGFALRHIWGDQSEDQHSVEGPWLFNDATRELRLWSVDKIPDVIEELSKQALDTTKKIQQKTQEVRDLAAVIVELTNEPRAPLSTAKRERIVVKVRKEQKFLAEVLEQADRWEIERNELHIYYSASKRAFAEMLQGSPSYAKVASIANEVLGYPVRVVVKLGTPPVVDPTVSKDKGGK